SRSSGGGGAPRRLSGASEMPQLPVTTVVTPWLVFAAISPASSARSSWVCTSMNPGASARPCASITSRPCHPRKSPITVICPSVTARSPTVGGVPLPSNSSARWINRSQVDGSVMLRSALRRQDHENLLHVAPRAPAERRALGHEDRFPGIETLLAAGIVGEIDLTFEEVHQLVARERRGLAVIGRRRP